MTQAEGSERDAIEIGEPEEAELAEEELEQGKPAQTEMPDEERAEDELEPLVGGAETIAALDEEEEQERAPRPGTEPPPA